MWPTPGAREKDGSRLGRARRTGPKEAAVAVANVAYSLGGVHVGPILANARPAWRPTSPRSSRWCGARIGGNLGAARFQWFLEHTQLLPAALAGCSCFGLQTAVRQRAVLQPTADAERAVYPTDVHGARDWPVDPAQKPVQLLACLLGLFANRHELVGDLTCGAGTTAVPYRDPFDTETLLPGYRMLQKDIMAMS
eukprot:jgi/Tetstr1/436043/TSEL_024922.t1